MTVYENYIINHSLKEDLKEEMQSDDLIERGSEFQTEHVFGTNELRYELVRQKGWQYKWFDECEHVIGVECHVCPRRER